MKTLYQRVKSVHSLSDAISIFWDYLFPPICASLVAVVVYWAVDREPARTFIIDPDRGIGGYITPGVAGNADISQKDIPITAGTPATVHWFVEWNRNCDEVGLFQEIVIQTPTSAPQVIRLEKIIVRSRANPGALGAPKRQWITRDFFVPTSANICTKERCAPIQAVYRATLSDYCNPVHKLALPVLTESPEIGFTINPAIALPPLENGTNK
jgi:hypothetical protein